MVVPDQLINVLPVNQDFSLPELNAKLHANQTISETEPTDVENAQTPVNHAHQPPLVLHVLNQETNQSTEFVTLVFTHVPTVLLMNNVLDV